MRPSSCAWRVVWKMKMRPDISLSFPLNYFILQVNMMVLKDGSCILVLGDLRVHAIGIVSRSTLFLYALITTRLNGHNSHV